MAATLEIRVTETGGEIRDLSYRYMWSAWLGSRLVAKGHASTSDEAEAQAMDKVTDRLRPEDVQSIRVCCR